MSLRWNVVTEAISKRSEGFSLQAGFENGSLLPDCRASLAMTFGSWQRNNCDLSRHPMLRDSSQ